MSTLQLNSQKTPSDVQLIYQISQSLIEIGQLPDALQKSVDILAEALVIDRVVMITFDLKRHQVTGFYKGGAGRANVVEVDYAELWDGLSGWVLRERRPALSPGGAPDPRESPEVQQRRIETLCGSIIVLPVLFQNELLGTLTAINRPDQRDFTQTDVDLLLSISNQVAAAIAHNRLSLHIGERRQAEAALARERARLHTLINTIPDMVWLKDPDGLYLGCNPVFERMVGLQEARLVGKSDYDLFDPELAAFFREHDHNAMATGQPVTNKEWVTFADDGRRVLLETIKTPMYDDDGVLIGVLGIARDITEHRRGSIVLEERVRARTAELETIRQRLELATRAAGIGIWDWVYTTGEMVWDDQMLVLYGITRDDFGGSVRDWERGLHPDDLPAQQELLQAVLRHEREFDTEFRVCWPDGSVHYIKAYAITLFDENGQPTRMTGVNYDITLRKQSEAALRHANDELERAMRMKDEFLASMSHELRTPLNGILGFSEAMKDQIYGALNERQLKALAHIENSGRHLLDLINDILDVSKIEARKLELQFELCSLDAICNSSLQLIKGMAQQKQQSVDFVMQPERINLWGDTRRLKQILVNLLSNAVKFTPEGGALGLEVSGNEQGRSVRLSVWDRGIGIKPEELARLFRPFVQLDSSLSRQHNGTGLGLALVQRLTELHGGYVEVESSYGQGSRFSVILPWLPAHQQAGLL